MDISCLTGTPLFRKLSPEKQERILAAALKEFAVKGYRQASMNSVVKSAGISKGSLFQYFQTKRDLFGWVVYLSAIEVKEYLKRVRDESSDLDFIQRLKLLILSGFSFIDRHPLHAGIYFHVLQTRDVPKGSEHSFQLRRLGFEFTEKLVNDAMRKEQLRENLDPSMVALVTNVFLESLMKTYFIDAPVSDIQNHSADTLHIAVWVETAVDILARGLQRGVL